LLITVDEERKLIHVPDCTTVQALAEFLDDFPEGEYEILIHEFDEDTDFDGELRIPE